MQINLGKNFEKLPKLLSEYETIYDDFLNDQNLEGKTIGEICKINHRLYGYYEERSIELKHVLEYMEMRLDEIAGRLYSGFKKGSNVALGEREILRYIKADPAYIEINIKRLEVQELYEKFNSAVTTFKNIGYQMNNLTKLKVASLDEDML